MDLSFDGGEFIWRTNKGEKIRDYVQIWSGRFNSVQRFHLVLGRTWFEHPAISRKVLTFDDVLFALNEIHGVRVLVLIIISSGGATRQFLFLMRLDHELSIVVH